MNIDAMFQPLAEGEAGIGNHSPAMDWTPVMPLDSDPLTDKMIQDHCPADHSFARRWDYHDAGGQLAFHVVRYDRSASDKAQASKQVLPFTWCEGPGAKRQWLVKAWPAPRPLYGLNAIAVNAATPVLVVEGEKAADAAQARFRDHVVTTSQGGSSAASKADWTALKGRDVTVWPDNDEAGGKYANEVARLATEAGAASVRIVKIPASFPAKWDLADNFPAGYDDGKIDELLKAAESVDGWLPPVPIACSLPSVEPFVPEMLPAVLKVYVLDVSHRQQCPPDFVAVAALIGIAAMIGNRFRVAPKQHDDWIVVPNLWGAIIGPPSAMKSPAMNSALGPIKALEKERWKEWQEAVAEAHADEAFAKLAAKERTKKVAAEFKKGNLDEARKLLGGTEKEEMRLPSCPRLIVNDTTVEKLGELLSENPSGLLLLRDELPGFLSLMEKEEYAGDRAFYLEAFNGDGSFTYDRIGRGTVHIANCTLSMIGGIQPSRVAPVVRGAIEGKSNDGFVQRLQLAVWPDQLPTWQWVDRPPDNVARTAYEAVFRDLHGLDVGSPDNPNVLRFSDTAQAMFREWMEEIQTEARSGKLSSVLESHVLKMPRTVAALALIFELVAGGRTEIGEQATGLALGWADYLRSHADRIYSSGNSKIEDGARLIIERRNKLPEEFTVRDVHEKDWAGLTDVSVVTPALDLLVTNHWCREVEKHPSSSGGRPTVRYRWNPRAREL